MVSYPGWDDGMLRICYLKKGDRERAQRILDESPDALRDKPSSPCGRAWSAGLLGDLDEAFRWLDVGLERHDILMPFVHVYTENLVPAMARDPRFDRILTKMNLPRWVAGPDNSDSRGAPSSASPGR
jgi:hypothetical protein